MAGFKWSSLTTGQLVAFDRLVGIPHFDDTLTSVVEVDLDPVNITRSVHSKPCRTKARAGAPKTNS